MKNKPPETQIKLYKKELEECLDRYLKVKYPEKIWESMRYSVLDGGKRLRALITLETCRILCGDYKRALPTSCAIEMLHSHSLIHDDLPCMDNDDFRRGKPSNHKAFTEAIAVLAGDALISYGLQIIFRETPSHINKEAVIKLAEEYVDTAGANGLIAGQVVDIESEGKNIDEKTLKYIHDNKTGKLFKYAFRAGAILAEADDKKLSAITQVAEKIGLAFQIRDDILDITATKEELGKTPQKDVKAQKTTSVNLFGVESASAKINYLCGNACDIMLKNNINSEILLSIIDSICERTK